VLVQQTGIEYEISIYSKDPAVLRIKVIQGQAESATYTSNNIHNGQLIAQGTMDTPEWEFVLGLTNQYDFSQENWPSL
jgi:hypothetical protein